MSVLLSVTYMAPGAAVTFSILFAVPYAGGSTPLAVLLGLAVLMLVAISIGQLAKHLPSAGGLYTYNARGLGAVTGFLGFNSGDPWSGLAHRVWAWASSPWWCPYLTLLARSARSSMLISAATGLPRLIVQQGGARPRPRRRRCPRSRACALKPYPST